MALPARHAPPVPSESEDLGTAAAIESAVADLYRACHLPPPAVLVARDAVHFARLACRIGRPSQFRTLSLIVYLAVLLPPLGLALQGDEASAAFCGFITAIGVPWVRSMERPGYSVTSTFGRILRLLLATLLIGATVAGLSLLGGFGGHGAVLAGRDHAGRPGLPPDPG
jgi:hypothetical protein